MVINVSQLAEKIGTKKRQRAKLQEAQTALVTEEAALVSERESIEEKETVSEEDKARLAAIKDRRTAINGEFSENETAIAEMSAAIDDGETILQRATTLNAREVQYSDSSGPTVPHTEQHEDRIEVKPPDKETRLADLGCVFRVAAACNGMFSMAPTIARTQFQNDRVALAMEASSFSGGGFMVPEHYVADLIDLLTAMAVVRSLPGLNTPPLVNGSLTLPKATSDPSAAYLGEGENITKSQAAGGQRKWTEKKLAVLVPVSNDLLRTSSPSADAMVRNMMVRAMALKEDLTFMRSTGVGAEPKGMRYWATSANQINVNGTVNLANVTTDLGKLELALDEANVPDINRCWLMAPRSANYLMNLRDGNGNKAFPEMDRGELRGKPFKKTTQIPTNLAVTDTSESEIYLVEATEFVLAESPGIGIEASNTAAYHDGSAVQAAFSLDQTVLRLIARHDFGPFHDEAVAVLTDVDWGA